jgi:hypothetical protein
LVASASAVIGWAALVGAWTMLAIAGVAGAQSTPSAPVTIGADLSRAPDVAFDCSVIPFMNSVTGQLTPAPGGPSCTWGSPLFDASQSDGGGLDVPGTGTIDQVKLRVGASTGPMQIVILRTLFNPADTADNECCVAQAASSVFTPVANATTTLNVALPVAVDANPNDNPEFLDQVGLSILEDGVPVPLVNETGVAVQDQPVGVYEAPAVAIGQSKLDSDPSGFALDMQALWSPSAQSAAVAAARERSSVAFARSLGFRTLAVLAPRMAPGPASGGPLDATAWRVCGAGGPAAVLCRLAAAFGGGGRE